MADNINPFNKDAKYNPQIDYWQREIDDQDEMYRTIAADTRDQHMRRTDLEEEAYLLLDPNGDRATEIQGLLKGIDKEKAITENEIMMVDGGRTAAEAESEFIYTHPCILP